MSDVQQIALVVTAAWLAAVGLRFRTSTPVLIGGMALVSGFALAAVAFKWSAPSAFGLAAPAIGWPLTLAAAAGWTALMLAYSPAADWIASRFFAKPPTLGAFRALQESKAKLIGGIVVAWILGGFLEELVFRGVVLTAVEAGLGAWLTPAMATTAAVLAAALGAGLCHYYQGPRAMVIVTQLSVLFGVLYVITGHNLWAVILCHGFYDTIAFIRFATKQSKYSDLERSSDGERA